jgi:hypothetical protein
LDQGSTANVHISLLAGPEIHLTPQRFPCNESRANGHAVKTPAAP